MAALEDMGRANLTTGPRNPAGQTVAMANATCVSCSSVFEREVKRGRPMAKCPTCRTTVLQFSKNGTIVDLTEKVVEGVTWVANSEPCVECTTTFMRPKKRGRPPTRCPECQEAIDAEKATEVTVSDEKLEELYSGPKKLLQGTKDEIPKGAEAQCPRPRGCGRIFTSDSAAEDHKVYGANGNLASCKDPASLGMEPRERRGIPIWTRPTPKDIDI